MNLRSIRGLRPTRQRAKVRHLRGSLESLEARQLLTLNPPAVGGSALVTPADFRVTVFAQGLNFPTGVVAEPDGSLLVALNKPPTGGTNFYDTTGQVVRLVDTNGDGVADGSPTLLADGLPGGVSAIQRAGAFVIVTSSSGTISFLRSGASPTDALTPAGSINLAFPNGWWHQTYALAVRPARATG